MSRSNQIPIRMKVENNRLVPASAFDQECLSSYQNGAVLQVYFWQGRNPDLLRKFWAILSRVLETCKTPWEDKEEAADALKLVLGITDVGATINGQMFVRPGSISFASMDEARFRKFFDDAMGKLYQLTGVDPETLSRESADTGQDHETFDPETGEITDNPNPGSTPPPAAGDDDASSSQSSSTESASQASAPDSGSTEGLASTNPISPGADMGAGLPSQSQLPDQPHSDTGKEPGVRASEAASGSGSLLPEEPVLSSADRKQLIECCFKLMAIRNEDLDGDGKLRALTAAKDGWKATLPTRLHPKLSSIFYSAQGIIKGTADFNKAINEYAHFLECAPEEIGG